MLFAGMKPGSVGERMTATTKTDVVAAPFSGVTVSVLFPGAAETRA